MITSKNNEKYKLWNKLKLKKYRDKENMFLVYGEHLIEEAKKHGEVMEIVTSNNEKEGTLISEELMKEINVTETSYDIFAVCKKTHKNIHSKKVLIMDDIQDPDNVGALIRSASAFGFLNIVMSEKTADFYNEKVVRASQGAIFHVSHKRVSITDELVKLRQKGYNIYTTNVDGDSDFQFKNEQVALILGNEGKGVREEVSQLADEYITINTQNVESLNVSIAGAILMYEWSKL